MATAQMREARNARQMAKAQAKWERRKRAGKPLRGSKRKQYRAGFSTQQLRDAAAKKREKGTP